MTVILVPGVNPKAAEELFDAIKKELKNKHYDTIELKKADENQLNSRVKEIRPKILIGKSLGGRVVVNYQVKHQDARALILLAPAVRINKIFTKIEIPVLIIHGTIDPVIPIENSRSLIKIFKNGKLVEILDADHGFKNNLTKVITTILDWISSIDV